MPNNYIDADNNYHSTTIVTLSPFEYVINSVQPVAECISSIEAFIADSPFDTAAIATAEAQLAKFKA